MKKRWFLLAVSVLFLIEIAALFFFAIQDTKDLQNAVFVNEAVQSVQEDWDAMEQHKNQTNLDYVVLDTEGAIRFRTKSGLSETINQAVIHRDTILDIWDNQVLVGKIIIYNDSADVFQSKKQTIIFVLLFAILVQGILCVGSILYLNHSLIKPFQKLKGFAERIAGGNLEVPLEMDRQNLFGAFTESFDIMRTELKKARQAQAKANESKKELVAKLSHDIKTPVASIKAASEVGAALTEDEKIRENYKQIIQKTDQITALVNNLFTAALEELKELSVTPSDLESRELKQLLENADYLHHAAIPVVCDCLFYADKLRLQQVLDNVFFNSYKYADTKIDVTVERIDGYLVISIEDYGGGVKEEELPLLKEKFKRGSNAENIEGAGLGLFISDYFMKEMKGEFLVENGKNGLRVVVMLRLSGRSF